MKVTTSAQEEVMSQVFFKFVYHTHFIVYKSLDAVRYIATGVHCLYRSLSESNIICDHQQLFHWVLRILHQQRVDTCFLTLLQYKGGNLPQVSTVTQLSQDTGSCRKNPHSCADVHRAELTSESIHTDTKGQTCLVCARRLENQRYGLFIHTTRLI